MSFSRPDERVGLLTVVVKPGGITLNHIEPVAMSDLEDGLRAACGDVRIARWLSSSTIGFVWAGGERLDIAKASGATDLALLNFKQRSGGRSK